MCVSPVCMLMKRLLKEMSEMKIWNQEKTLPETTDRPTLQLYGDK